MTGNSKPLPNDNDTKLRQFLLLFGRQKAIPTHLINSFAASTQKMGHSVEIFFLVKIKLPVTHFYLFAKCSIVSFKSSLKLFRSSSVMVPSPSRDIILKKRFDLFISHWTPQAFLSVLFPVALRKSVHVNHRTSQSFYYIYYKISYTKLILNIGCLFNSSFCGNEAAYFNTCFIGKFP